MPDGLGGTLSTWVHLDGPVSTTHITRVTGGSVTMDKIEPAPIVLVGEETAYVQDSGTVRALDVTSLVEKWSTVGEPIMTLGLDGVAIRTPVTGTITAYLASGVAGASFTTPIADLSSVYRHGEWLGQDAADGALVNVAGIGVAPGYLQASVIAQQPLVHQRTYQDPRETAVKALRYYNPRSISGNTEFAGSLCRLPNGRYHAGIPNEGLYSDQVIPAVCSRGVRRGDYHTHGYDGNDGFSGPDIQKANLDVLTEGYVQYFVGTPCGHIDSYVGPPVAGRPLSEPNPSNYIRLTETTTTTKQCLP